MFVSISIYSLVSTELLICIRLSRLPITLQLLRCSRLFRVLATKNRCPGILHAVHRPLRHLDDFSCRFGCYAIFRSPRSTDRLFLARSEFYLIPRACQGFCSSTFSLSFLIGLLLWSGSFLLAGDCQTIACLVQRVVLYTLPRPCQGFSK